MSSTKGKSNVRFERDEQGNWFYPPTQRSDGTWRKPIPVRDTAPELQEKYVCRGRREADAATAAAAAANLVVNQEQVGIEEEDTTDFRMDRGKKDGNARETSSTTEKKSAPKTFSMPRMDGFWNHYVSTDPVVPSEPKASPKSVTSSNANSADPRKGDRSGDSWKAPSSQDVASVPVVDFEEKCRTWKNTEDICEKMGSLKVSDKKAEEDRALAVILGQEKDEDMKDFEKLVTDNQLSPPDYVNSWNYLVTKWIHIQQMMGVKSKAEIVKMAKSNKLMM